MIKHKLNGKTILWVEVPIDAKNIGIAKSKIRLEALMFSSLDIRKVTTIKLEGRGWQFLSLSKDMTEEMAISIYNNFECDNQWCENGYIDMGYNEKLRCHFCQENEDNQDEPLESFRSIEKSLNIYPNKNYAILIEDTQI